MNLKPLTYGCESKLVPPKSDAVKPSSKPSDTGEKTWTKENYKTADPNCNDYCTKKNMRCSFVNLKPLTYGCKGWIQTLFQKIVF